MAEYIENKTVEFGFPQESVQMAEYTVVLNRPTTLELKIVSPTTQTVTSWTDKTGSRMPPFHMYSKSASVSGKVVYANYGRRRDFQTLLNQATASIITKKIVLIRVGKISTAAKIRNAEMFGAAAVLIYGDHQVDLSAYMGNGDPSTPFGASVEEPSAYVLSTDQMLSNVMNLTEKIPEIPSMPISTSEAETIFQHMDAEIPSELEKDWTDGDGTKLEGQELELLLNNNVAYERRLIKNVMVTIQGDVEPDRFVIVGSQRDSMGTNVLSPGSGVAVFLEVLRGLGALVRGGWTPRRTIILASWGAEQYSLTGSTEWMQEHLWQLQARAVAYFDIGVEAVAGAGYLFASGSPSLIESIYSSTLLVREPSATAESDKDKDELLPQLNGMITSSQDVNNIYNVWLNHSSMNVRGTIKPLVNAPGFRTYSPLLSHIGIPTMMLAMVSSDPPHNAAATTTLQQVKEVGDPGFLYHRAVAHIWGNIILNVSDNAILPMDFREYAHRLSKAAESLKDDADTKGLRAALSKFNQTAYSVATKIKEAAVSGFSKSRIQQLNDRLYLVERAFIQPDAHFSYSSWWKHVVYAPSWTRDFQVYTFGQIQDAGETPTDLKQKLYRLTQCIQQATALLV